MQLPRLQGHEPTGTAPPGIWSGPETKHPSYLDQEIVGALAASQETHRRLAAAARAASSALLALGLAQEQVVLYGSLSVGRTEAVCSDLPEAHAAMLGQCQQLHLHQERRGVPSCFITDLSDVDCAALLPEQCHAGGLVERLTALGGGGRAEWSQVHATVVPRFAVTQWTMLSDRGVQLDLSCFTDPTQFARFKARQRAFRDTFWQTRRQLNEKYGEIGAEAFDAYIYLLKAFAAVTMRTAMTSFQAICLGVYALQRRSLEKRPKPPSGLVLLRRFLVLCRDFFAHEGPDPTCHRATLFWHNACAIDVGGGGRLMERSSRRARAELYFVDAETSQNVHSSDWMNVLHNVDPQTVSSTANTSLDRWFTQKSPKKVWKNLKKDLLPVMKHSSCVPR